MNKTIAITGATGFIGSRLVTELLREGGYEIRVLSRDRQRDLREQRFGDGVEICEGDLSDPASLKGFLVPSCTVVHLAYLRSAGAELNLACTNNLVAACRDIKVARLVHCSTADVAGRTPSKLIDENTPCLPINEYGATKLKIEQIISEAAKNHFDAVILRPTAVLGIGGEQLKKLAADLNGGIRWKNYLRSCLFGRRRMNLVPVGNVVAALIFLIRHDGPFSGDVFIVSNDDDPLNNFIEVERFLMDALSIDRYSLPRIPVPLFALKLLLMSMGRNNVNPQRDFDSSKLRKLGFKNPVNLSEGLAEYATWYRAKYKLESVRKAQ